MSVRMKDLGVCSSLLLVAIAGVRSSSRIDALENRLAAIEANLSSASGEATSSVTHEANATTANPRPLPLRSTQRPVDNATE